MGNDKYYVEVRKYTILISYYYLIMFRIVAWASWLVKMYANNATIKEATIMIREIGLLKFSVLDDSQRGNWNHDNISYFSQIYG